MSESKLHKPHEMPGRSAQPCADASLGTAEFMTSSPQDWNVSGHIDGPSDQWSRSASQVLFEAAGCDRNRYSEQRRTGHHDYTCLYANWNGEIDDPG